MHGFVFNFECLHFKQLLNRTPSRVLNGLSSFELLYKNKFDISQCKVFRAQYFPCLRVYLSNKLEPHFTKCVFLCYDDKQNSYICYDINADKFIISKHVVFKESKFPFSSTISNVENNPTNQPMCYSYLVGFILALICLLLCLFFVHFL